MGPGLAAQPSEVIIAIGMQERHAEIQPITLRDARTEEAEAIGVLLRASYAQYEAAYTPNDWPRYYGMLGDVSRHFEHARIIVAEMGGALAGSVMFYPDGSRSGQGEWPEGWAGILRLAVHPDFRGHGIGRLLTEECVHRARAVGAQTVGLHATEWMAVSRGMYERMGFVRDESFDFVTRGGTHAMGYRLDLS
jgi:ribosomal protein S18 acetylase RimI-like enzyme